MSLPFPRLLSRNAVYGTPYTQGRYFEHEADACLLSQSSDDSSGMFQSQAVPGRVDDDPRNRKTASARLWPVDLCSLIDYLF